ncbi:PqqD family peptide modification chaperone [candidate division CSSED10-310 bacterium]|uniref:PqqD family peptide modification chaperone n=1 Tax=candidate division CSSED10-310 bacterium TaxID=2855610 RepID=A0ABV6Z0I5_UNCC1
MRSVRRFMLPVHIGLTAGWLRFSRFEKIKIHPIQWQDDFADARNQLLKQVDTEFVLWVDSDEVLVAFPELDWTKVNMDIFGVRLQESDLWTPRMILRLHRNRANIQWTGRIDDRLMVHGRTTLGNWRFLPSVVIRHFGYDDPHILPSKVARNMSIAKPGLDGDMPSYSELLTAARTEAFSGRFNPLLWLKCFKHQGAMYYGFSFDQRLEAAEMLCSCGYLEPARFLLAQNPLLIRLHLAMLAAQWRSSDNMDQEQLGFFCECLSNGFFDPYYSFPRALLGADQQTILAFIKDLANSWETNSETSICRGASTASLGILDSKGANLSPSLCFNSEDPINAETTCAPIAVCLLSHGNQEETACAVRSARRFGLPVHIGLTAGSLSLDGFESVSIYPIPWQDDFSATRNRLLQHVEAEFVLWLDSDEVLFAFPEIDWPKLAGDIFRIFWQSYGENTPAAVPRLHRNKPGLSWFGRIHEIPYNGKSPLTTDWKLLHSLVIRHSGYKDSHQVMDKHERNLRIAQYGLQGKTPSLSELLSLASWQSVSGVFNTLSWVRYYKKVDALTFYDVYSAKVVPAEMLCSTGYTRPARLLLKTNPVIIPLHFAILAAEMQFEDKMDTDRLDFVVQCLQNGYYYPFVDFPHKLLGANRENCLEYINQIREEWGERPNMTLYHMEVNMDSLEGRFRRIESFDSETFVDDLLVMHNDTRDTVVLNPAAAVLWEALKWSQSLEDLVGLLAEAFPSEEVNTLRAHVEKVMGELISRKFIVRL